MSRPAPRFNATPFAYHQELEIEIDSLTNLGKGVGRVNDWVVFVSHSLPGERVKARVFRNSASFSEADLVEVVRPSPDRVAPRCSLFGQCGGCQYQNLSYSAQLDWKRGQVAELLQRMAGIEFPVAPVHPSPLTYGYRSKITPHFQKPKNGQMGAIGFLVEGRLQQVLDVPQCPIASETINAKLPQVRREVTANARSYKKGATLLLRDSLDGYVCTDPTEMCEQQVGALKFSFHAGEFFQNNPHILSDFADHVKKEALGDGGVTHLVDAYCGSGLFCLTAARDFEEAVGIEISESSIDWAKRNASQNGITNCRFITGDASNIFGEVNFPPTTTAVVIDPPRKGSSQEFLDQLITFGPRRVVYVSCNPATQIRDLEILKDHYNITNIQPFDLFPQTRHLECVVTLERK
ncbi:MAG: class I SAM-dependent RNA methyltransferase [Verrucomicrobiales bacterium]|nr:class I SAM-dependent RNA methyltransferase [Verrucomicrobiales bacterium]HQW27698.1 class I SAM-dependent RNA methyltransferase [Verrucomicrobiales bacterium]